MSALRAMGAIALADLRERTRRQSFVVAVVLVGWVAWLVASGTLSLRLDVYQGVMNAPWLGSVMALVVCTFVGWLGFFLINSAVDLDRVSGVGELLAASPVSRVQYVLAKWLANFAVLGLLVAVLMIAGLLLHWRSLPQIVTDLPALLTPIAVIALPLIALAASCAVLFESVGFLRGARGTMLWLFGFWVLALWSQHLAGGRFPALDLIGIQLLYGSMAEAARAAYPAYHTGFVLGFAPHRELQLFPWAGVDWSVSLVMLRLTWVALAGLLALCAALCFDRFDPAAVVAAARASAAHGAPAAPRAAAARPALADAPLPVLRFAGLYRLRTELFCLLKGVRLWWWAVPLGLAIAGLAVPSPAARGMLLLASWIWPVTIWSAMGCREARAGVEETVFSSPHPLLLQLPGQWLAGFLLALLTGGGVLLRLAFTGDTQPLLAALAGAALIPSLALMLGVTSGTPKVFEVLYLLACYIGPLQGVAALDFMGAHGPQDSALWLAVAGASLAAAFLWRWRQLQR